MKMVRARSGAISYSVNQLGASTEFLLLLSYILLLLLLFLKSIDGCFLTTLLAMPMLAHLKFFKKSTLAFIKYEREQTIGVKVINMNTVDSIR